MSEGHFENNKTDQPDNETEKPEGSDRRGFLKKAAIGLVGLAGVAAIKEYGPGIIDAAHKHDEKYEKEIARRGNVNIIGKEHTPPIVSVKMPFQIEGWKLTVEFKDNEVKNDNGEEDKKGFVRVSKEQYEHYAIGDEIPVTYKMYGKGASKYREDAKIEDGSENNK